MLRKGFLFLAISIAIWGCSSKSIEIEGNLKGLADTKAYLNRISEGAPLAIDTVDVKDGKFIFTIDKIDAQLLVVFFEGQKVPLVFFGGDKDISATGEFEKLDDVKVTGSESTALFAKFNNEMPGKVRTVEIKNDFMKAQMSGDQATMNSLREEMGSIFEEQKTYFNKFVETNTNNAVGAFMTLNVAGEYDTTKLKELIAKFETALGEHVYVNELKKLLEPMEKHELAMQAVAVGKPAPEFTLKSSNGADVSLSSFKGKYVLVDFWASWCAPCRQENPNVVKAYAMFNKKGFEVVSVSTDREEEKWLQAVEQDKMTWTQVRDLDGSVSQSYAIQVIPTTFLLDKDGVIIAKDLRGDDLINKLEELMK